ncbi:hypothetical protein NQ318_017531 [Aromia moschata]|uniref:C2H2-type domain-containing protein n=1 Tax=Aromia moschata TaxID=1265417 RepID=A0AAV8Z2Z9_9CUCU|nr:hypothetical protein NQ318_017531 [Aromia moschata]
MLPSPTPEIISRATKNEGILNSVEPTAEPKSIKQFHVIQKYTAPPSQPVSPEDPRAGQPFEGESASQEAGDRVLANNAKNLTANRVLPTLKVNDMLIPNDGLADLRKRKFPVLQNHFKSKVQRNDEVMDLSMTTIAEKQPVRMNGLVSDERHYNGRPMEHVNNVANEVYVAQGAAKTPRRFIEEEKPRYAPNEDPVYGGEPHGRTVILLGPLPADEHPGYGVGVEQHSSGDDQPQAKATADYDNSAMETLADVATRREKLDKNTLAKSVASEFLKLATKNESPDGCREAGGYAPVGKDVNDIIVKSEGNKSCTICAKSFNKPSQLRLHMNIHYLERPFRCDSCSVSFRTKGHLQKHERSASHHNKLSSSPALSSSEPRPFKCSDCNIAFRIHGHLAKHLRSKMHIMKLECLAKIPFGLYAELERSNSLLTEINTCDGDQCLESLKTLAMKVFINDPNKLNQLELRENVNADS